MRRLAVALATLLFFGILTMWVEELWAWSAFQVGIFLLSAVRLLQKKPVQFRSVYIPLTAAAVWPLLQLASRQTLARAETWTALLTWETFLLVFLLACDIFADVEARTWFLTTASLGGSLLAALSVIQKYSSGGKIFWLFPSGYAADVLGPFVNRNQFAAWIELLLPAALYFAVKDGRWIALYGTGAAILFSSVIASGARMGSVLVLAEAVGVILLFAARHNLPRKTLVIRSAQIAGLAGIAVALAGSETLRTRLESFGPEPLRVDALRASIKMIGDHAWTGIGLGAWSTVYPRYATIDTGVFMNQAHNDWVQWAAEGGVLFLLLLVLLAAQLCKPAFRSIYGVGVIAFLLHSFVDYPMQQRPALACWFFAIAGAAVAVRNEGASRVGGAVRGELVIQNELP
jgi:hypothetical protein